MTRRSWAAVAAVLFLVLTAGCGLVPSRPDAQAWSKAARQSLEDAASEVATVKVTLQEHEKDHLLGGYGAVAVTDSEEALGLAQDSILTKQPPSSKQEAFDQVSAVLGDAGDLVTRARIALVAGQEQQYPRLVDRLEAMTKKLDDLRSSL